MNTEKKLQAWSSLYDKYAPAMYRVICNHTDDSHLAGEILKEAFLQLKEEQVFSQDDNTFCHKILKHTHNVAEEYLAARGIASSNNPKEGTTLSYMLCSQYMPIDKVASHFKLSKEDAMKKLRLELLQFRSKAAPTKPIAAAEG